MKRLYHFSVLIALIAIFIPTECVLAENVPAFDPWASCYPGSWITVLEVEKAQGETTTSIVRKKITSKRDGLSEVWNFTEDGSRRLSKERNFTRGHTPKTLFMKRKSTSTSNMRVGSSNYKTHKVSYVPEGKFSLARGPLTMYYSDQIKVPYREMLLCGDYIALPENVLRAEYVAPDRNTGKLMRYETQIVYFYSVVPVDDEKIPCFLEETKVIEISSSRKVAEAKRWLSDKIPGHTVMLEYHFDSPYGPGDMYQTVQKYHQVRFRPQSIAMEGFRITFEMPEHFRNITRYGHMNRYPVGEKNSRIFSTEDSGASIIVQVSEPSVLIHKVEDLKISMEKRLSQQIPDLTAINRGFTKINGRQFIYHEFISITPGKEIHTYKLATLHKGKILSLDFDVSRELSREYEQLRRIWVGSIKIE